MKKMCVAAAVMALLIIKEGEAVRLMSDEVVDEVVGQVHRVLVGSINSEMAFTWQQGVPANQLSLRMVRQESAAAGEEAKEFSLQGQVVITYSSVLYNSPRNSVQLPEVQQIKPCAQLITWLEEASEVMAFSPDLHEVGRRLHARLTQKATAKS